jgi:hypothetical protein
MTQTKARNRKSRTNRKPCPTFLKPAESSTSVGSAKDPDELNRGSADPHARTATKREYFRVPGAVVDSFPPLSHMDRRGEHRCCQWPLSQEVYYVFFKQLLKLKLVKGGPIFKICKNSTMSFIQCAVSVKIAPCRSPRAEC